MSVVWDVFITGERVFKHPLLLCIVLAWCSIRNVCICDTSCPVYVYTRVQYINHEKADIDAVFILAVNAIVDGYIWVVRIAPCSSVGRAIDCRGTDINRSLVRFQSGRFLPILPRHNL